MRKSLFSLALALTIMLSIVAIAPVQTAEAVASGGVTVTCNVLTQEATITLPNNGCTDVVFTQGAAMVSGHVDFGFTVDSALALGILGLRNILLAQTR
jgi:hypothetical protein